MTIRALAMPWALPGDRVFSRPRDVLITVALGEDPAAVPTVFDVRRGAAQPATSLDGGAIDSIVKRYAGNGRYARVHAAAASLGRTGAQHLGYDAAEQVSGLARSFIIKVPAGAPVGVLTQALSQVATITAASPNYVAVTPFDAAPGKAAFVDPQGENARRPREIIRAAEALAKEPGDPAVLVGLVDSGIARAHPEVGPRLRSGFDTVQMGDEGVAPGITLLGDHDREDSNPTDGFVGHGMGCAGIIAGLGVRMPAGIGGAAQIIPLRALAAARLPGKDGAVGIGAISDLDAAVKLAVDLGAKVINMSFGTDDSALSRASPKPHADVIRYALDRGCILVAASGNNGRETRYWPAAFEGVIAVGACDAGLRPTGFTTRGDHVALSAPGERVLSCGLTGYAEVTGTSFAAPFVAGAAALLVARGARRAFPVDGLLAREILTTTAQPFAGEATGCGAGILDAAAALAALDSIIDQRVPDDPHEIEDG